MKCQVCKKDVSEDSLFCEHCGAKIEKPKEKKDNSGLITDKELKQKVIDHLEFVGYEVKMTDATGGYTGTHVTKNNLWFSFKDDVGISFISFFNVNEKKIEKNKALAYQYINKMNNISMITNFSLNDNLNNFICGAWYPNMYSKKTFATFMELFETDIRNILQLEGVRDLFT